MQVWQSNGRLWRRVAAMVGALAVAAGLAPGSLEDPAGAEGPPNVVVIMTDDQTLEELRVLPMTQALIGDQGTMFTNFVVTLPLCCPSRATYLTGQYAFRHGVLSNDAPRGGYTVFDNTTALPVWLQAAGYRTIHIGKFMNGYGDLGKRDVPVGWNDWQGLLTLKYFNYRLNDNRTLVDYGSEPEDYLTDVLAARAEEAIAESAPTGPFFLNLGVFAPHKDGDGDSRHAIPAPRHQGAFATEPLPMPPNYNELDVSDKPAHIQALRRIRARQEDTITSDYRSELESLLAVDELVARVITALDTAGVLDHTVVIFTSDNGFHHGEHRVRASKGTPYEETIHMPLMIRGPGFTPGATVDALTANIDLAPTIAAITGATPLLPPDGLDLRTVASDPGAFADRGVVIETYDRDCFTGIRTASETYVRYYTGELEYYDLTTDPFQLTSRHLDPTRTARIAELDARLDATLNGPPPACG